MLSIFREETYDKVFLSQRARELLISSLNKGIVPLWEDFFKELPATERLEELEEVKNNFMQLTCWPFLCSIIENPATEFLFHSPEVCQFLTIEGRREKFAVPLNDEDWQLWLEVISLKFQQNWNVQQPFASFYGKIGSRNFRWTLIHSSTSPEKRSKLVLRSLSQEPHPLSSFGETRLVEDLIRLKNNFVIAGATGSGKTSLLTSLLSLADPEEHIVVLEDTYEILSPHRHLTRLLSGDTPETSLKSYLAYSLRLSPDRIVLGEMRSHEVVPFVMAMNTGHKGLLGSIHAASAVDTLHRLALLFTLYSGENAVPYEKVMELICRNLEYVVFLEAKKVKEVIKVLGSDKGTPFFETVFGEKKSFF